MTSVNESQIAGAVLMIQPACFHSNPLTAASNAFQGDIELPAEEQQRLASREFSGLVTALSQAGIEVINVKDTADPPTPDAVFPNNWVSFHADGTVVLYPMEALNRRTERRPDIIEQLASERGFHVRQVIDLSAHEQRGHFLEGTGSLVLDRVNRVAYACLSSRTHLEALGDFAQQLDYEVIAFEAVDRGGAAIYHTNVLMSIGEELAFVCLDAVPQVEQRNALAESLERTGHRVVELSMSQLAQFAGNMLELRAASGGRVLAMSDTARGALTDEQLELINANGSIASAPLHHIEMSAGGSARCMLAEIHLPRD